MQWKLFLSICRRILGEGALNPYISHSWCSFTTFSSLKHGIHYWSCGFPDENELLDDRTLDGGLWSQSFYYDDLAHLIVPAQFYWESTINGNFCCDYKMQDIELLASELNKNSLEFRKTELVLEVKLY